MAKFDWYNELSEVFMGRGYFVGNQTIQDRINDISKVVTHYFGDEIGNKAKDYLEEGYYVVPSPVWSNVGTGRGAGISCFNTHFSDSVASITKGVAEIAMQCKIGGGTSGYYDLRAAGSPISGGGESMGPLHFLEWIAKTKETISQGQTRRGEHAAYMDITHPDAKEFLNINGEGSKLQRLPFGICISDEFIDKVKNRDQASMELLAMVYDSRNRTGFPYIFFTDNVNNNTVDVYKTLKKRINASNMCTEILLPSNDKESFVCDLLGMNLVKYDEWKQTDAVRIAVYICDAVLQEFIDMYDGVWGLERAVAFAKNHRAIGIGGSGYHSLLQSKMIPFESWEAKALNVEIWKFINAKAYAASEEMAMTFGKANLIEEYNKEHGRTNFIKRRHTCLLAIAPNTSSSFIMGQQSQSIEPYVSNYYIKKSAKVKHAVKNPYLEKILIEKNQNTSSVWESILKKDGSVQHLDFLSDHEKLVFRTFIEISQMEVIIQASSRQKYIDQGQSLNLMIHPSTPTRDVNALVLKAHELGIKTLYYQLGQNAAQEFARDIISCEVCAG